MRTLDQRVLLEACVENATSKLLQLAQVKFETAPDIKALPVHNSASLSRNVEDLKQPDIWLESYADSLQVSNFSQAAASANFASQQKTSCSCVVDCCHAARSRFAVYLGDVYEDVSAVIRKASSLANGIMLYHLLKHNTSLWC